MLDMKLVEHIFYNDGGPECECLDVGSTMQFGTYGDFGVTNGHEFEVRAVSSVTMSAAGFFGETFTFTDIVAYSPVYTIFDNDGPEDKCMITKMNMAYEGGVGYEIGGTLMSPSLHNKSGTVFLGEQQLRLHFKKGAPAVVLVRNSYIENDMTIVEFELLPENPLGEILTKVTSWAMNSLTSENDNLWDNDNALVKAISDVDFVGRHLYAKPSEGMGVFGVVPKIESLMKGGNIQTATDTRHKEFDAFYRLGQNNSGYTFTDWTTLTTSATRYDDFKMYITGDVSSSLPSGTALLINSDPTTTGIPSAYTHTGVDVIESIYHPVSMATYCEVMLSPDIMQTINSYAITASTQFDDYELLLQSDLVSLQVSGGSTYTDLMYINKVTARLGGISSASLPPSGDLTPIIATHGSIVNYFNIFTKTDGTDPYAGKTEVKVGNGTPIAENIIEVLIRS